MSHGQGDLAQLFRRMVYNVLCNNADGHLRNPGFIYMHGHGWRLSPAYDMVPQPDRVPQTPRLLTLGVGINGGREATLDNALSACPVFGLLQEEGEKIITTMKTIFLSQWEKTFMKSECSEKRFAHAGRGLCQSYKKLKGQKPLTGSSHP